MLISDSFLEIKWDVAISWQLQGLRGCYGVNVPLFGCVYHLSQVRNTFQYPLSKRACKCLPKRVSGVVAFIIELYLEYESRGMPCHCAAAVRSLTCEAEIM